MVVPTSTFSVQSESEEIESSKAVDQSDEGNESNVDEDEENIILGMLHRTKHVAAAIANTQ